MEEQRSTQRSLLEKADKPPMESKKMIAAVLGVSAVLIVWLGTLICMFIKTDTAGQFVSLATIVVSFIGAVTTALITGQSAMEWKSMSTIAQVDTNDKDEVIMQSNNVSEKTKRLIIEGNGNKIKPFGQLAIHPEGCEDE